VAVRDHGVGLKPGEAQMVFDRFWRADPARARTTGGTGLGLSISREDAQLHGGWLQAWGEPGVGSQFRLSLPRVAGAELRGSPLPLVPTDVELSRSLFTEPFLEPEISRLEAAAEESAAEPSGEAPSSSPSSSPASSQASSHTSSQASEAGE
jgi:two-component system sensor histidine kinase MtrB